MKNRKTKHKKKVVKCYGTPYARFNWIMDELEKRYPDPNPLSSSPPELRFLAALDYERAVLRESIKLAQTALNDWLRVHAPEECNADLVAETRDRLRQFGTVYYIAMVQQQLFKALNGDQDQDANR